MKPSDFYFCLHNGAVIEEDDLLTVITFCPVKYWDDKDCLPDYSFDNEIEEYIPTNYPIWGCSEETQWCSEDSEESIRQKPTQIGFVENFALQKFLSDCWE
jgi:hypothetical protein